MNTETSLYSRLGGYDAITAVVEELLPRLMEDKLLARFWQNRADDGLEREKQLLIDYLCNRTGGEMYYTGRDMLTVHKGMGITDDDWNNFIGHLQQTLQKFEVPDEEKNTVLQFIDSKKSDIVD